MNGLKTSLSASPSPSIEGREVTTIFKNLKAAGVGADALSYSRTFSSNWWAISNSRELSPSYCRSLLAMRAAAAAAAIEFIFTPADGGELRRWRLLSIPDNTTHTWWKTSRWSSALSVCSTHRIRGFTRQDKSAESAGEELWCNYWWLCLPFFFYLFDWGSFLKNLWIMSS